MIVGVVTPALNAAGHIGATVSSIVNQDAVLSGDVQLRYVVQDGGSTDDTVDIAKRVGGELVTVASAPDTGMYDALASAWDALDESGGADWYCYLNAGDKWEPSCLDVIRNFARNSQSQWLCGLHTYYAASGSIVHTSLPFRYRRELLRAGAYGRGLPTVQQESTFWHRSLHQLINRRALRKYAVAGDAYLWWTFAQAQEPTIVQSALGGFTYHGEHLGVSRKQYRSEIEDFAGALDPITRGRIAADRLMWEQPARVKARFNPNLYLYNTATGGWHSHIQEVPPLGHG
jgi:glycosyltransferase involved in cell wall biosynthesis